MNWCWKLFIPSTYITPTSLVSALSYFTPRPKPTTHGWRIFGFFHHQVPVPRSKSWLDAENCLFQHMFNSHIIKFCPELFWRPSTKPTTHGGGRWSLLPPSSQFQTIIGAENFFFPAHVQLPHHLFDKLFYSKAQAATHGGGRWSILPPSS